MASPVLPPYAKADAERMAPQREYNRYGKFNLPVEFEEFPTKARVGVLSVERDFFSTHGQRKVYTVTYDWRWQPSCHCLDFSIRTPFDGEPCAHIEAANLAQLDYLKRFDGPHPTNPHEPDPWLVVAEALRSSR